MSSIGIAKKLANEEGVELPNPSRSGVDASSVGVYARVAALLHESRHHAPDELGAFLGSSVADFGMQDLSVYVTDFEQRHLVAIPGSAASAPLDIDTTVGGQSFSTATQLEEPIVDGVRLWSVVVDGAARLGVFCVTFSELDEEHRQLADSLAGVVAALLVTRGQCTDASRRFGVARSSASPPRCSGTSCRR